MDLVSNQLTDSASVAASSPLTKPSSRTIPVATDSSATTTPSTTVTATAAASTGATPSTADNPTKDNPADRAALKKSVDTINSFLQPHAGTIEFSVDEDSGKMLLKVVDHETNTVLMQIPSKEALILSQTIGQTGQTKGFLIQDTA
jgi:flagellar protein FlaG